MLLIKTFTNICLPAEDNELIQFTVQLVDVQ